MSAKMKLSNDTIPNPFADWDSICNRVDQCESLIAEQDRIIRLLTESVGLLMRIQNIKDDRARSKHKPNTA